MVLIVFTIMLLNIRVEANKRQFHKVVLGTAVGAATLVLSILFLITSKAAVPTNTVTADMIKQYGHTELIGKVMFTEFLLPFEVTSILLLAAIVGAVILAKRKLS